MGARQSTGPSVTHEFRLPLPPTVNELYRSYRGRSIKSKKYRDWLEVARPLVIAQCGNLEPSGEPAAVRIELYVFHLRDVDSSDKPLLDVLQGIIYRNDRQIVDLRVTRHKVANRAAVGVRMTVTFSTEQP